MTRGPAALAAFAGSWRFDAAGSGTTRVVFRYHLKARRRGLRTLLDPILAAVFAHDTRLSLRALKRAAERAFHRNVVEGEQRECQRSRAALQ